MSDNQKIPVNNYPKALYKVVCDSCYWCGMSGDILYADSPFDAADTLVGCPSCNKVNTLQVACAAFGCGAQATCKCSAEGSYTHTCFRHLSGRFYK